MRSASLRGNAGSRLKQRQGGVALAMLLWFVAAMSLLVAAIVMQARVDVKLAQLHAAQARIEAAADGAIQLALAQMMLPADPEKPAFSPLQSMRFTLGGFEVLVTVTPVSGLININQAPEELLLLLFSTVPGMDEASAGQLTTNVVDWRTASAVAEGEGPGKRGKAAGAGASGAQAADNARHGRFEANEDLLLVTGIDRRIYEAVQDSVYVSQEGQSGVDWTYAPVGVLQALLGGDAEAANALVETRVNDAEKGLVPPVDMNLTFQEARTKSSYRIDALVKNDGSVFSRRRWVNRDEAGSDGLPWSFFRTEALRVIYSATQGSAMSSGNGHAGN